MNRKAPNKAQGKFAEVVYGSDGYQAALRLRQQVLRAPLGLSVWDEDLALEANHRHFTWQDEQGRILACILAVPMNPRQARLRQMAVSPGCQGTGLGRILLQHVEAQLWQEGVVSLVLHARDTARAFYEKLGYLAEPDAFEEVGIKHWRMTKLMGTRLPVCCSDRNDDTPG